MCSISNETIQLLRNAIIEAVSKFETDIDFQVITDIHMQLDADTGILTFCDDEDLIVNTVTIEEWIDVDGGEIEGLVVKPLRGLLRQLHAENALPLSSLSKPFTFVLEDAEHETIEELYFVDDETIFITEDLLKGLDKELDDFLLELMNQ